MNIFFPTVLAGICGLVLWKLVKNEKAQPFIIAYWVVLLIKNLYDIF